MKVVVTCAGTGGHINPGIAIANILNRREKNCQILFIGTKTGLENDLVPKAGYDLKQIRAGRLQRRITLENVKNMYNAYMGIADSKKILKDFKPDIVIGTGGYICASVMMAAKALKIPYILHESNVFPGMAVKLGAKNAAKVLTGFEDTKKHLKYTENVVYTGTPAKFTREDIENLDKYKCRKKLEFYNENMEGKGLLFVTGGSQGAAKINKTVIDMVLNKRPNNFYTVIATGAANYDSVLQYVQEQDKQGDSFKFLNIQKFIYEMDKMYTAADLLITRAGAMTVTELGLSMRPAILVPLPTAAENHQYFNAKSVEDVGAGVVLEEKDLTEGTLYDNVMKIILDGKKLKEMTQNAKVMYKGNVDGKIYDEIKSSILDIGT